MFTGKVIKTFKCKITKDRYKNGSEYSFHEESRLKTLEEKGFVNYTSWNQKKAEDAKRKAEEEAAKKKFEEAKQQAELDAKKKAEDAKPKTAAESKDNKDIKSAK